ncbi:MAG TPA: hypothetical protein VF141_14520 [Chryseolinea sp.]
MKKFIYIVLFAAVTALSVTSCTEEEVKPKTMAGGGAIIGDPK